jgi:hypothetical protein
MRLHPDMPYQKERHSAHKHHASCAHYRLNCPFDQKAVEDQGFCKTCNWGKGGK